MDLATSRALHVDAKTAQEVIFLILEGEETTRTSLAKRLGISAMTVGKVVRFLLDEGWIKEGEGEALRGRTPARLIPSEAILYGTVFFEAHAVTLLVASVKGDLEEISLPYNPTLSPEGNLAAMQAHSERFFSKYCPIYPKYSKYPKTNACLCVGAILSGDEESERAWHLLSGENPLGWDWIGRETSLRLQELAKPSYRRSVCYVSFDRTWYSSCLADGVVLSERQYRDQELREEQKREWIRSFGEMRRIFVPDWVIVEGKGRYAEEAEGFLAELKKSLPEGDPMNLWSTGTKSLAERALRSELNRRVAQEIVRRARSAE